MSIHKKLMTARLKLQDTELKKTGFNKFASYYYFTLADFLPQVQKIFGELGLCGVVSYTTEAATLTITDTEDSSSITITSPMAEAALKGCHPIQNIGAVETYQRRYLWVTAMEMVEFEVLDATTAGKKETKETHSATDGVLETLSKERIAALELYKDTITDYYNAGRIDEAYRAYHEVTDTEEKIALWGMLKPFSKCRTAIKAYSDQHNN